jgi:hypothetical protein
MNYVPCWPGPEILLISASQKARIAGVSYCLTVRFIFSNKLPRLRHSVVGAKNSVRQKFTGGKRIRVLLKKYLKCGNGFVTEK